MTIAHLLQDFSSKDNGSGPFHLYSDDSLEDLRLSSFEQGYKAGWEDAVEAGTAEDGKASEALTHSLEDLSFSFHEARAQVVSSLEPLFSCLSEQLLPDLAAHGLRQTITGMLTGAATDCLDPHATLFVPTGQQGQFRDLQAQSLPMALDIEEDPCLTEDQVILKLGGQETALDANALVQAVRELFASTLFEAEEDVKHG